MKRLGDSDRGNLCADRLRQRKPLLDGLFREIRAVRRNQNVLVHVFLLSADGRQAMLISRLYYHPLMEAMSITGANLSATNRDDKSSFFPIDEKKRALLYKLENVLNLFQAQHDARIVIVGHERDVGKIAHFSDQGLRFLRCQSFANGVNSTRSFFDLIVVVEDRK